jgi:hypothetical protein
LRRIGFRINAVANGNKKKTPFSASTAVYLLAALVIWQNAICDPTTAQSAERFMPKPILQSMILADHVYEDKLTGKRVIAGVFNRIIRGKRVMKPAPGAEGQAGNQRVLEIPPTGLQSGSPFAYLSVTEVRGQQVFTLQFVNLEDNVPMFRSEIKVECQDPLYTIELTVPLPPLSPPSAGVYALELLHENELLGALRIVVDEAPS